eukprot:SAG25_NODE_667_length_6052_cov_7.366202_8_plen_383_part_00
MIGEPGAGTTSLIARLRNRRFLSKVKRTAHIDSFTHSINLPGLRCKVELWDCGCLAEHHDRAHPMRAMAEKIIKRADAVLVTYESPQQRTVDTIRWVQGITKPAISGTQIVAVRTKADQERTLESLDQAAAKFVLSHAACCSTSAKTGYGIHELLETVVGQAVISCGWHPARIASRQRLAWAQASVQLHLPDVARKGVAGWLQQIRLDWGVIGQAQLDATAAAASRKQWHIALRECSVAWAVLPSSTNLQERVEEILLYNTSVTISGTEESVDRTSGEQHTAFQLVCIHTSSRRVVHNYKVLRRYSDFVLLHTSLLDSVPGCPLPSLPPKRLYHSTAVLEERRQGLQHFLRDILRQDAVVRTGLLQEFIAIDQLVSQIYSYA